MSWARIACIASAVIGVGWVAFGGLPAQFSVIPAALLVAFMLLVKVHDGIERRLGIATRAVQFHDRALGRIDESYKGSGDEYAVPKDHPYAWDLDIVGKDSLLSRLDCTQTTRGQAALRDALTASGHVRDIAIIRARQAAIAELSEQMQFREQLFALAGGESRIRVDPDALLTWAKTAPPGGSPGIDRLAPWILAPVSIATWIAAGLGQSHYFVLAAYLFALLVHAPRAGDRSATVTAVMAHYDAIRPFVAAIELAEQQVFVSPTLQSLSARLRGATAELSRLDRLADLLRSRENGIFRIFIAPFLGWEPACVTALDAWRGRDGARLSDWLDALGELESLASLSTLAFERKGHVAFPTLSEEPRLVASELRHPLLDQARCVANDVALEQAGRAYVITGSNMSGKSTYLRALGLNVVLSFAGAPAFAKSLTLGPMRVMSSMRVEDSLSSGVSHFLAEVKRLRSITEASRETEAPVLFLLDEILHGTNSRERVVGAKYVLWELVRHGALGCVTTHDLGLASLAPESPEHFRNVHFRETVADGTMSFDYLLRDGVVTTSNALRVMRQMGLEVPIDDETPDGAVST